MEVFRLILMEDLSRQELLMHEELVCLHVLDHVNAEYACLLEMVNAKLEACCPVLADLLFSIGDRETSFQSDKRVAASQRPIDPTITRDLFSDSCIAHLLT